MQDPQSAKFSGMPQSAIDAGVVDYTLSVPLLAAELVRLSRHPYLTVDSGLPSAESLGGARSASCPDIVGLRELPRIRPV